MLFRNCTSALPLLFSRLARSVIIYAEGGGTEWGLVSEVSRRLDYQSANLNGLTSVEILKPQREWRWPFLPSIATFNRSGLVGIHES
jgi:hypothetical protein